MVVKLDIQKFRQGLYWTNRYLLDLADPSDVSLEMIEAIANTEGNWHATTVTIVSARVSDMVEGTDNFIVYPLNITGAQLDGGDPIPGFVTLRADFGVGVGRPLRKYWRTYAAEALTSGGNWSNTFVAANQALLVTMLAEVPSICDPQGNRAVSVAVKTNLQMRQLRRGTRKKTQPVIPLG